MAVTPLICPSILASDFARLGEEVRALEAAGIARGDYIVRINDRKVLNGAIYGLASHGKFMGAFKPGNRARGVKGLYLAGGAAHPGPGMPMVMMSGWIAADAQDQDARGGRRASA